MVTQDIKRRLAAIMSDELDSILELLEDTGIDIERDDKRIRIVCE